MSLPDTESNKNMFVGIVESVRVTVKIASIAAFGLMVLFYPSKGFPSAFGVRGLFGYSFAITGERYGDDVSTTSSYLAPDSQGVAYMGEILYRKGENLEVGLGLFNPFGFNDSDESDSFQGGTALSNKATLKFRSIPVVASIYIKHPIMKKTKLLLGWGMGYAFGGNLEETNSGLTDYGAGRFFTRESRKIDKYSGGTVLRSSIGAEYEFGPSISFFVAGALSVHQSVIKQRETTVSGVSSNLPFSDYTYETIETIRYQHGPAPRGPASSTTIDNRVAGTGELIFITESPGNYMRQVNTYVNGILTDIRIEETSTQQRFFRRSAPFSVVTGITYYF